MNATDHDRIAEEMMIETGLTEHLGGEEPGRGPEEVLAALEEAPAGRIRSMRGMLEIAAAVLLLAFAAWGLPHLLAGNGPAGVVAGDPTLDDVLGAKTAKAFRAADGPVERLRILVPVADEIRERGVSKAESLLLGEGILEVAPWRDRYDDGKHQKDLFALRELCEEKELTFLGGLFARMAVHTAPYVRLHGVYGLEFLGAREFADVAREATTDPDARVRSAALSAVVALGGDWNAGLLARALDDPDPDVRKAAVRVYDGDYRLGGGAVRPLVLEALEDPDPGVRMAAATRIEEEQDRGALPHLLSLRKRKSNRRVVRVFDSTIRVLTELDGFRRPVPVEAHRAAPGGGRDDRGHLRVKDAAGWRELTKGLGLEDPPAVDFSRQMVLVVFRGRVGNCNGVSGEVLEDEARITLRYRGMWYQSMGETGGPTAAWGLFVVPRSKKPVVFEENTAGIIGMPPVWTVRGRLAALD